MANMRYKKVSDLKKADCFIWANRKTRNQMAARPSLIMPLIAVEVFDNNTIQFVGPETVHVRQFAEDSLAIVIDVLDTAHAFHHEVMCLDCDEPFGKHHGMQCSCSTPDEKWWFVPSWSDLIAYHGDPKRMLNDNEFFDNIGL